MAQKISGMTAITAANLDDTALFEVVDKLGATTKATIAQIRTSTEAIATPGAFVATTARWFASTVSGATLMGFGTTGDVSLKNRAGTTVLGILGTVVTTAGALSVGAGLKVAAASLMEFNGRSYLASASDGTLLLSAQGGGFTRLNFGGATSSFVGLATSTVNIAVVGGDGSAVANLGIGGLVPGTGFVNGLFFGTTATTEPSATVDLVHVYGFDLSAGNRALAVYAEAPLITTIDAVVVRKVPFRYNGATIYLAAMTSAA